MSNMLEYNGYQGSIEPDADSGHLYGKILFINDLVTYSADTIADLKREFAISVDEYLKLCEELGDEPNKPYKGSFNVRTGEELHRNAAIEAARLGITLNEYVKGAIELRLESHKGGDEVIRHEHSHNHNHKIIVQVAETIRQSEYSSEEDEPWQKLSRPALRRVK